MSKIQTQQKQIKTIESLMLPTYEEAQASSRWVTKQSIALQLIINKEASNKYLKFKSNYQDIEKNLLSIAANLSVSFHIHEIYKKRNRKNANFIADDLLLSEEFELNSLVEVKRVAKKEKYLREKLPLLVSWRNLGVSIRKISNILQDKYNVSISRETIRTFLQKQKEI